MVELTPKNQGYWDRLKRAKSWIKRADSLQKQPKKGEKQGKTDRHGPFIFYWIAFNALYGQHREERGDKDREDMERFLREICNLDLGAMSQVLASIESDADLKSDTDLLLKDKYLSRSYWEKGHSKDFEKKKNADYRKARIAYGKGESAVYLTILFRRLRMLRNQIFHGCSTDRDSLNKKSLRPALKILEKLVKQFLKIFQEHQEHGEKGKWGKVPYPRKNSPQHPGRSGASSSNQE